MRYKQVWKSKSPSWLELPTEREPFTLTWKEKIRLGYMVVAAVPFVEVWIKRWFGIRGEDLYRSFWLLERERPRTVGRSYTFVEQLYGSIGSLVHITCYVSKLSYVKWMIAKNNFTYSHPNSRYIYSLRETGNKKRTANTLPCVFPGNARQRAHDTFFTVNRLCRALFIKTHDNPLPCANVDAWQTNSRTHKKITVCLTWRTTNILQWLKKLIPPAAGGTTTALPPPVHQHHHPTCSDLCPFAPLVRVCFGDKWQPYACD
jgi:hypothetical protein